MSNEEQPQLHLFAAQLEILRERLTSLLATLHKAVRADVIQVLEGEGKLLHDIQLHETGTHPPGSWALLPLLIAQYLEPTLKNAALSSIGVAVECFVCALDLLDDVEDEDQTPIVQNIGIARALNVSTTLLMMAQQALLSLSEQAIPDERVLRILHALQSSALEATAGQHRDLLAEHLSAHDMSDEECIEIAAGKAGAIMGIACLIGALLADADKTLCTQFREMGVLLGIAHQLDNDSHDLYYLLQEQSSDVDVVHAEKVTRSIKSDLTHEKKTLPVVLAAQRKDIFQKNANDADKDNERYKAELQEGIIATWGICLLYRDRAYDYLQRMEVQKPVAAPLRILLGFE